MIIINTVQCFIAICRVSKVASRIYIYIRSFGINRQRCLQFKLLAIPKSISCQQLMLLTSFGKSCQNCHHSFRNVSKWFSYVSVIKLSVTTWNTLKCFDTKFLPKLFCEVEHGNAKSICPAKIYDVFREIHCCELSKTLRKKIVIHN
jgi:hypothetical protein